MTTEVEVLDEPRFTTREMVERLGALGLQPGEIAQASGASVTVVRTIIKRHTVPDPELEAAWRNVEMIALAQVRKIIVRGPHTDRMALLKIITGRSLSKRAGQGEDTVLEELRTAWNDLRDEQRVLPAELGADVIDAFPAWDDDTEDEGDE